MYNLVSGAKLSLSHSIMKAIDVNNQNIYFTQIWFGECNY